MFQEIKKNVHGDDKKMLNIFMKTCQKSNKNTLSGLYFL